MALANNTTRAQRIILLTTIETIFRSNQLPRAARNIIINKKKRTRSDRSNDAEYTQGRSLFFCRTFEHLPWL